MGRARGVTTPEKKNYLMKEETKMFLERAEKFKKNAKFNFDKGEYDLAMFHIEQSIATSYKSQIARLERLL